MPFSGALQRVVFMLVLLWVSVYASFAAQAAERYTLVLKDGRRIVISGYEEAGDRFYYYRYDARVGLARSRVKEIIAIPENEETVALEDVIVGRVLKAYNLSFGPGDFLREEYYVAEIEPRLTPEEQQAYVRKLVCLKKREIIEIDDERQIAEADGDVVAIRHLEARTVAALNELAQGEAAGRILAERLEAEIPEREMVNRLAGSAGIQGAEGAAALSDDSGDSKTDQESEPVEPRTDIGKLHHKREMLRLVIRKNYRAGEKTGGVLALQQARQDLRIVDLQIRYVERLKRISTPSPVFPKRDP
ncbi:MAG: hypothetical protein JJV98_01110 [Desulfosarcina sp.]|nr:hypothetical protein [Desulfobacterales bacterium]